MTNADLTFSDLVDYLADRRGQQIYVEIGMHDHDGPENADLFMLKLHGFRLGKVEDATDYSSRERRGVMVWLEPSEGGLVDKEGKNSTRFFITPPRVTAIQGRPERGLLKVWLDDAVYLNFTAS